MIPPPPEPWLILNDMEGIFDDNVAIVGFDGTEEWRIGKGKWCLNLTTSAGGYGLLKVIKGSLVGLYGSGGGVGGNMGMRGGIKHVDDI